MYEQNRAIQMTIIFSVGHGSLKESSRSSSRKGKVMRICPLCKATVRADRINEHRAKYHGTKAVPTASRSVSSSSSKAGTLSTPKPDSGSLSSRATTRAMLHCNLCRVAVREDRLARHIRKVHHSRPENDRANSPWDALSIHSGWVKIYQGGRVSPR